ncbi:MAG: hypothetical protein MAG581_02693 [Deltaproteobacteria bacterium]|nr:hypothetical protein [Deltaproteobacteria bacterium]
MSAFQSEIGRSFTGNFEIELFDSPTEELTRLQPKELIAGYWRELSFSWKSGTTLSRTNLQEIS